MLVGYEVNLARLLCVGASCKLKSLVLALRLTHDILNVLKALKGWQCIRCILHKVVAFWKDGSVVIVLSIHSFEVGVVLQ